MAANWDSGVVGGGLGLGGMRAGSMVVLSGEVGEWRGREIVFGSVAVEGEI